MRFGMVGLNLDRALELTLRPGDVSPGMLREPQIVVRFDGIGIQFDCPLVAGPGLVELSQCAVSFTQIDMNGGLAGGGGNGLMVRKRGLQGTLDGSHVPVVVVLAVRERIERGCRSQVNPAVRDDRRRGDALTEVVRRDDFHPWRAA